MDRDKVEKFLKSVGDDFKHIKFIEDDIFVTMKIGNFLIQRKKTDDYDYDIKKLFEDFLTNTTAFYINIFWEQ